MEIVFDGTKIVFEKIALVLRIRQPRQSIILTATLTDAIGKTTGSKLFRPQNYYSQKKFLSWSAAAYRRHDWLSRRWIVDTYTEIAGHTAALELKRVFYVGSQSEHTD